MNRSELERRGGEPRRRSHWALAGEVGGTLGAWLKGQLIVACILSVLYAVGFAAVRLPFWYLLAPVCGFLNFIPYFGYLVGLGLTALVGLLGGLSFERLIAVVLVYVAVGAIESWVLTPRILGKRLGLRPLYVFLAILVAGTGFGFIGLLLAVPVLAVGMVVWRFYGTRPAQE
ncbi:MAG TPA: AI-2E family transporter [Bryobacteraceae bacterium]|nr:AI-2E family transporter [Bryobacteraceae bacterium]